ncbi:hypothetical protein [Algoriphagus alkaliphilus]|uniref:hypothetical protein n=1 Tax=Algoriphagus alkaliphilus TaxID=279824 RepID=UPI001587A80D|nr:hypothetical protein [Algoriphagus alkaliphilus]
MPKAQSLNGGVNKFSGFSLAFPYFSFLKAKTYDPNFQDNGVHPMTRYQRFVIEVSK